MLMFVRQTGYPGARSTTRLAQLSQNPACLHGTRAKLPRGAMRHISRQSSGSAASAAFADSDTTDVFVFAFV